MEDKMLTTTEAATRLGISGERVRQLIKTGRLPSQQFGRDHLIKASDLKLVADRKPGRPSKPTPANGVKPKAAKKAGEMPGPELKARLRKKAYREK